MRSWWVPCVAGLLVATTAPAGKGSPSIGLELSANGAVETPLYQGWPLVAEILVVLEENGSARLDGRGIPWTSSLDLVLHDGNGKAVAAVWQPLGATAGPFTLTEDASEAAALYGLAPAATQRLEPGPHTLQATLDMRAVAAPGAWTGSAESQRVRILVSPEPRELPPEEWAWKRRVSARWLQLNGKPEEALAELALLLERDPDNIQALREKAEALTELGRHDEAAAAVERALGAFRIRNPGATHPPRELLNQAELIRQASSTTLETRDTPARPGSPAPVPPAPPLREEPAPRAPAPGPAPGAVPPRPVQAAPTAPPPAATPLQEYENALRRGDELFAAGGYHEAVRAYESAGRVAYRNKLDTDKAALEERLARARQARDAKKKR